MKKGVKSNVMKKMYLLSKAVINSRITNVILFEMNLIFHLKIIMHNDKVLKLKGLKYSCTTEEMFKLALIIMIYKHLIYCHINHALLYFNEFKTCIHIIPLLSCANRCRFPFKSIGNWP